MNSTFNLNLRNNKGATIYFKAHCFASDKLKYVFGFRRKTHLFFWGRTQLHLELTEAISSPCRSSSRPQSASTTKWLLGAFHPGKYRQRHPDQQWQEHLVLAFFFVFSFFSFNHLHKYTQALVSTRFMSNISNQPLSDDLRLGPF